MGRMARPFETIFSLPFAIHQYALSLKKIGDVRLIHHLSYPDFDSVNYFIDPDFCTVKYSYIDEAFLMIQLLGQGTLLTKTDLKSAHRLLPIYQGDFDMLGFKCYDKFYFDKCLLLVLNFSVPYLKNLVHLTLAGMQEIREPKCYSLLG